MPSGKADALWADLCASEEMDKAKAKKKKVVVRSEKDCLSTKDKTTKKKKAGKKKSGGSSENSSSNSNPNSSGNEVQWAETAFTPPTSVAESTLALAVGPAPDAERLLQMLQRPIQQSNDPTVSVRIAGLRRMHDLLVRDYGDEARPESLLPSAALATVFEELAKPLFKRFGDPSEQCRELSVKVATHCLSTVLNLTPHLAYFFPALLRRMPQGHMYDPEMSIFIHDIDAHEAHKRGRANVRQDKAEFAPGSSIHTVVEPSEEMRLLVLKMLSATVTSILMRGSSTLIHPYFHDIILFLQCQLRDPYPDVKIEACRMLTILCRCQELNQGFILYATALARAGLPVLRHRHAKVRFAAVEFVRSAIAVPHKAKWRGAGTDAIVDLIGYQAEDTIPVAAFYEGYTTVNYLAELTADPVVAVRLATAEMLSEFLVGLLDRYDHRTRLVPYLLNAVNDDASNVSAVAMNALALCGKEYEKENQDEIIERRQYGVDGDRRANHGPPLPRPFEERPRLGTRLYVRGATRRFFKPLLRELTSWMSKTRGQSLGLLQTVIVYVEESLTQDLHTLVPEFCKALKVLEHDAEYDMAEKLIFCCELLGRYIPPDSHIPFLLPRLRGDLEVLPGGTDAESRSLVLRVGAAMMRGSLPSELLPHLKELFEAFTDESVLLSSGSASLRGAALDALSVLATALQGRGSAAIEAHFLATGRLTSKAKLFATAARALLVWRQDPALTEAADKALHSLAMADGGEAGGKSGAGGEPSMGSSTGLSMEAAAFVGRYAAQLAESARSEYELDVMWDNQAPDHIVLVQLLEIVPVPQRLALPQPDDPVELEAEAGAGSQGEDNIPSPPSPSSREAATPTPAMAKRRAHALAQDAARIQAAAEALGALVGQVADLLAEAGKPLGQGGIADEMTPDQASLFRKEWANGLAAFLERIVAIPTTAGRADICPPATATRLADTVLRFFLPPSWPEKGAAQVVYASGGRIADEGEDVDKGGDAKEAGAENGESESKAESDAAMSKLASAEREMVKNSLFGSKEVSTKTRTSTNVPESTAAKNGASAEEVSVEVQTDLTCLQLRLLSLLHALAVDPMRVPGGAAATMAAAAARRRRGLPPVPPRSCVPVVQPYILAAHLEVLAKVLVEHATDDSTTGATRTSALLSLERLLKAGRIESAKRLKAYEAMGGANRRTALGASWLRVANKVYLALLTRMQDPHQEVCAAAMSAMAEVLFYASPESSPEAVAIAEDGEGWLSLRGLLETTVPFAFVPTSYDDPVVGEEEGLAELAEHLLRQAAVLEPALFIEVVESENGQPGRRCQAYEDLLEHGRLLISLSSSANGPSGSSGGEAPAPPFDLSAAMGGMAFSTDDEPAAAAGGMFFSTDSPAPTDPKLAALSAKLSGGGGGGDSPPREPALVAMSTKEVEDLLEDLD